MEGLSPFSGLSEEQLMQLAMNLDPTPVLREGAMMPAQNIPLTAMSGPGAGDSDPFPYLGLTQPVKKDSPLDQKSLQMLQSMMPKPQGPGQMIGSGGVRAPQQMNLAVPQVNLQQKPVVAAPTLAQLIGR